MKPHSSLLNYFDLSHRFLIRGKLGAGGMGVVYEAMDVEKNMLVALKTLSIDGAEHVARFKNEFRSLCNISHHNLVRLYELVLEQDRLFFTMELIRGQSFLYHVRPGSIPIRPRRKSGRIIGEPDVTCPTMEMGDFSELTDPSVGMDTLESTSDKKLSMSKQFQGALDVWRLRAALTQLVTGVQALHEYDKVHRDLKPNNVIVTPEGRVVILDFGLVQDLLGKEEEDGVVRGSPAYMSPEQMDGGAAGSRESDWYSVGVILYQALTGRLPHIAGSLSRLRDFKQTHVPIAPARVDASIPQDLSKLCESLLDIDPNKRPTADEIMNRLDGNAPTRRRRSWSNLRAETFTGRDQEIAELEQSFEMVDANGYSPVLVVGESGIGKSELVKQFATAMEEKHSALVLTGRCYERERMPYNAWDSVAEKLAEYLKNLSEDELNSTLPVDPSGLGRLFPALKSVEGIGSVDASESQGNAGEKRLNWFRTFRSLLEKISAFTQTILILDDAQWADADSMALLHEVFASEDAPSLLLLATVRSKDDDEFRDFLPGQSRTLRLSALGENAVVSLIQRLDPEGQWEKNEASQLAKESQGHPMLLQELLRHASSDSKLADFDLRSAIWERVSVLGKGEISLLRTLAVTGAPLTQQVAALASGLTLGELAGISVDLRGRHLVRTSGTRRDDGIEPYHDQVRVSVRERIRDDEARRIHAKIASALLQTGVGSEEPERLVHHLLEAGKTRQAAKRALAGAARAYDSLAFEQAANLYEVVLHHGALDAEQQRELLWLKANALASAGRGLDAARTFYDLAQVVSEDDRILCRQRAAEQLLVSGHVEEGVEAVKNLLSHINTTLPASYKSALLSLVWGRIKLKLRGLKFKASLPDAVDPSLIRRIDVFRAVSRGLGMVDNVRGADFQTRAFLLALKSGDSVRIGFTMYYEACFLASQGVKSRGAAIKFIESGHELVKDENIPQLKGWEHAARGFWHYFGGEFEPARQQFANAEECFLGIGESGWDLSNVRLFRLWSLIRLGNYKDLKRYSQQFVRDADRRGDQYLATTIRRCCNRIWLIEGHAKQAQADLARAHWRPPDRGFHLQHWYALRADGELALYEGRTEEVKDDLQERLLLAEKSMLFRIQTVRAEATWLKGRLRLASTEFTKKDHAWCRKAAKRLINEKVDYARLWGLLLQAGVNRRCDQTEEEPVLVEAMVMARSLNMTAYEGAITRRLAELSGKKMNNSPWHSQANVASPDQFDRLLGIMGDGAD